MYLVFGIKLDLPILSLKYLPDLRASFAPMIPRTVCRASRFVTHQWPKCRSLHLSPPFLVEDYVPHYLRQQPKTLERKKEEPIAHLKQCNICPRYALCSTLIDI